MSTQSMSTMDFNDFGFTAVTELELEAVQKTTQQLQDTAATIEQVQSKLDEMYKAISPLLANLKQNPEKEYIYWPSRLEKVEQFEKYLSDIYKA